MTHVTFFRFKAQPGKRQAVIDQFDKWDREQRGKAAGYQRSAIVSNNANPDEFMAVVRFDTTANYQANSDRQEQDAWYRELRANLVSDPEWLDGTVVQESQA